MPGGRQVADGGDQDADGGRDQRAKLHGHALLEELQVGPASRQAEIEPVREVRDLGFQAKLALPQIRLQSGYALAQIRFQRRFGLAQLRPQRGFALAQIRLGRELCQIRFAPLRQRARDRFGLVSSENPESLSLRTTA